MFRRRIFIALALVGVAAAIVLWRTSRPTHQEALTTAVAAADRIRVRSGGTCHRIPENEHTLFEEQDRARVQELLRQISIDESASGLQCACCGDPSLEIYRGEQLLVTLGYHHGMSLRWIEGWKGDAVLTKQSAEFLNGWLSRNGVSVQ